VTLSHHIDRLTEAYLERIVTLEEYRRRRRELEERAEAIEAQMRHLEANIDRQGELTMLAQGIESFCQRVQQGLAQATFDEMRHLVELLIDRVIVTREEVEIRYVIPTSPRGEYARFYQLRLDYCRTVSSFAWAGVLTGASARHALGGC
jgi:site-specific DNA recombinase